MLSRAKEENRKHAEEALDQRQKEFQQARKQSRGVQAGARSGGKLRAWRFQQASKARTVQRACKATARVVQQAYALRTAGARFQDSKVPASGSKDSTAVKWTASMAITRQGTSTARGAMEESTPSQRSPSNAEEQDEWRTRL